VTSVWREIGDRVWVRRYESLDQSIGVIGGDAGLVVIDTRASHRLADELRDELAQLSGSVVGVINTHGHWDHVFGNARFLPTPIWGHVRCATMIVEGGEAMRARLLAASPAESAEQFREVELTPPTELIEDAATLDLGDRQVDLRHLGRGHTDNDVVVTVPDASVLFVGDLLENAPAPGFGDSYPIAWAETGLALLELVDGTVVPGHGDPFDLAFAQRQVHELATLAELARNAVVGAISLEDAIRRSPFPAEPTGEALDRTRLELSE
jgi:glyoxylase-like metal-dependent hydrolase (beta-lactamase superfamily II)